MKVITGLLLAACGIGVVCLARTNEERWPIREQETIQKTLRLSGAPMRVVVDNVEGYVHVTGTGSSDVRVTAHKTIRADADTDLAEAKRDVKLEMVEKPGAVSIYYDAPWRCNGEGQGCRGERRRFYNVIYDIDVQIPHAARPVISTVNRGDIRIEKTTGNFDVSDINGGITMLQVSGSGDVHTINGPVEVQFAKNPTEATSFKSINGPLNITFQPGLSADLLFKTFNGQVFSDFEVSPRPMSVGQAERRNGKFIYRSNTLKGGRAGNGGPEFKFDTLNGDIRLHRAGQGVSNNE